MQHMETAIERQANYYNYMKTTTDIAAGDQVLVKIEKKNQMHFRRINFLVHIWLFQRTITGHTS